VYAADVRDVLARVRAPALVLHRRGDRAMPFDQGREAASRLPGARFAALDGDVHLPWFGDSAAVVGAITAFLDGHTRAAPASDGALTRREAEVLRLVADGLGDAEIADRLVVSPHTVHRHVANIRTKLNQPSRAAAAAYAARHGLI
jgi:DNA-binding CsgD family transcriptional regulator